MDSLQKLLQAARAFSPELEQLADAVEQQMRGSFVRRGDIRLLPSNIVVCVADVDRGYAACIVVGGTNDTYKKGGYDISVPLTTLAFAPEVKL